MSTKLLKSKAFQTLLSGDFPLPASGCGWFFEQGAEEQAEYRETVRAFCALGASAVALLAEAVEHQEITRKAVSKMVASVENLGLIIIKEGDTFLQMPYRISPSLLGEDVLLALDDLLDSLAPAKPSVESNPPALLSP